MQKLLYTLLACTLFASCAAQRSAGVTISAYRQPVLQGVAPTVIEDISGKTTEQKVEERANYFIYVESKSPDIKVMDVWIRKVYYPVRTTLVGETPVTMLTSMMVGATADTLVKKTSNTVLAVSLAPGGDAAKAPRWVQKQIDTNELVLHCIINGKDHYFPVRAIKKLAPVALQ